MSENEQKKYTLDDCEASKEQVLYADILFYGAWGAILILFITFGLYVSKALPSHIPIQNVPHYWHESSDSWLNPWYAMKEPLKVDKEEYAIPSGASIEDISDDKIAAVMKREISESGDVGMDVHLAVMETAEALGLDHRDEKAEEKLEQTFAGFKEQGLLKQVKPSFPSGWEWTTMLGQGDFINFIGVAILAGMTILCFLVALAPAYLKQKDWPYFGLVIFECLVLLLAASGILKVGGH